MSERRKSARHKIASNILKSNEKVEESYNVSERSLRKRRSIQETSEQIPVNLKTSPTATKRQKLDSNSKKKDEIIKVIKSENYEIDANNADVCNKCNEVGELILCDSCPASYHLHCLDPPLFQLPDDDWFCPKCSAAKLTNFGNCVICKKSVTSISPRCKSCNEIFHSSCLSLLCLSVPGQSVSYWTCPLCNQSVSIYEDNPPELILSWRWASYFKSNGSVLQKFDYLGWQPREYLVKLKNLSYWHCTWVSELQLNRIKCWNLMWNFWSTLSPNKWEPVSGCNLNCREGELLHWGIEYDYLQVDRVVSSPKPNVYRVKWRNLGYDSTTLEEIDSPNTNQPGNLKQFVDAYNERVKRFIKYRHVDSNEICQLLEMPEHSQTNGLSDEPDQNLHKFQQEGMDWLFKAYIEGKNVLLADDKGLGKIVQSIVYLKELLDQGVTGPSVIVTTLDRVADWERELSVWAPSLYYAAYVGKRQELELIRQYDLFSEICSPGASRRQKYNTGGKCERLTVDLILTTTSAVQHSFTALRSVDFHALIWDISRESLLSSSINVSLLSIKSRHRILLANDLNRINSTSLAVLLNYLDPRKFSDCKLSPSIQTLLDEMDNQSLLTKLLGSRILWRSREKVSREIPVHSEHLVTIPLTEPQRIVYRSLLKDNANLLTTTKHSPSDLMNLVSKLLQCCNHPQLLKESENVDLFDCESAMSGKLSLLLEMLEPLRDGGHRVLVHCQSILTLDLLIEVFKSKGFEFEHMDGRSTSEERQRAVEKFNSPLSFSFIFLLSDNNFHYNSNLSCVDTVVLFDSEWSQVHDLALLFRSHRLGVSRPVSTYRFLARDSVEESIFQFARAKRVMQPGQCVDTNLHASLSVKHVLFCLLWGAENILKDPDSDKLLFTKFLSSLDVMELLDVSQEGVAIKQKSFTSFLDQEINVAPLTESRSKWCSLFGMNEDTLETASNPDSEGMSIPCLRPRKKCNYMVDSEEEEEPVSDDVVNTEESDREIDASEKSSEEEEEEVSSSDSDEYYEPPKKKKKDRSPPKPKVRKTKSEPRRKSVTPKSSETEPVKSELSVESMDEEFLESEQFGNSLRDECVFLRNVMRFGLPKGTLTAGSPWIQGELRRKSIESLNEYMEKFVNDLYGDRQDSYLSKLGLNRDVVLVRIAIMSLIRKKVNQYQKCNGCHSLSLNDKENGFSQSNKNNPFEVNCQNKSSEIDESNKQSSEFGQSNHQSEIDCQNKSSEIDESNKQSEPDQSNHQSEIDCQNKSSEVDESNKQSSESGQSNHQSEIDCQKKSSEIDESNKQSESDQSNHQSETNKANQPENNIKLSEIGRYPQYALSDTDMSTNRFNGVEAVSDGAHSSEPAKSSGESSISSSSQGTAVIISSEETSNVSVIHNSFSEVNKKDKPTLENGEVPVHSSLNGNCKIKNTLGDTVPAVNSEVASKGELIDDDDYFECHSIGKDFRFDIADGGLTELHHIWKSELECCKDRDLGSVWHSRHDYWLLVATLTHGYAKWLDMVKDDRFSFLNSTYKKPGETDTASVIKSIEELLRFLSHRFRLLEHALMIEEKLRHISFHLPGPESQEQKFRIFERNLRLQGPLKKVNAAQGYLKQEIDLANDMLHDMKHEFSGLSGYLMSTPASDLYEDV